MIGRKGSEAISGVYLSFDDIRAKLKQLQDDEKAANLRNKCRVCGKNGHGGSICIIDNVNRKYYDHTSSWNDVVVHDTTIGTPFSGGRMSISYPVADIKFIINDPEDNLIL